MYKVMFVDLTNGADDAPEYVYDAKNTMNEAQALVDEMFADRIPFAYYYIAED